jgi:DNA-binding PadR family transcriptional regulator
VKTNPVRTTTELTVTECAVLGLLADGEASGYDLVKRTNAGVGYIWAPAKSRVYVVLARLLDDGFVARRDVVQADRPDKQVYRITRAGERAFSRWLEEQSWRSHDELLLKVFFGAHLERARLADLVARYADDERARLADYRAIEERIAGEPRARFGYATLRFGLASARARIRWAEELLRELRAPA